MSERSKCSHEQYLEANRLHRSGFLPVSSKYRRAKAPPALPPESELLALLKKLSPAEYGDILSRITHTIARVVGDREVTLDEGTYSALKVIEKEAQLGRVKGIARVVQRMPDRVVEIRHTSSARAPVLRSVSCVSPEDETVVVARAVEEEIAAFEDATADDRGDLERAVLFLRKKGITVSLLSREEATERERRTYFRDRGTLNS